MEKTTLSNSNPNGNQAVSGEEKKFWLWKIIEKLNAIKESAMEKFHLGGSDAPKWQDFSKKISETEQHIQVLNDIENIPAAVLEGMYKIAEDIEGNLDLENLEKTEEAVERIRKTADEIKRDALSKIQIQCTTLEEAVEHTVESAEGVHYTKEALDEMISKSRIVHGKEPENKIYFIIPDRNEETEPTICEVNLKRDEYGDHLLLTPMKDMFLEYSADNREIIGIMRGSKDAQHERIDKIVSGDTFSFSTEKDETGKYIFKNDMRSPEEVLSTLRNAIADREGFQVYNEKLNILSKDKKFLYEHLSQVVKDESGIETTILPDTLKNNIAYEYEGKIYPNLDDAPEALVEAVKEGHGKLYQKEIESETNAFRCFDTEHNQLLVFRPDRNKGELTCTLYKNIKSIDSDITDRDGLMIGRFKNVNNKIVSAMHIPFGDISVQRMLESKNMAAFFASQGFDEAARESLLKANSGKAWEVTKEANPVNIEARKDLFAKAFKYAEQYGGEKYQVTTAARKYGKEVSVTINAPEGNSMRLLADASGVPRLQFREKGTGEYKDVYDYTKNQRLCSDVEFSHLYKMNPEFKTCFEIATATVQDHYLNVKDTIGRTAEPERKENTKQNEPVKENKNRNDVERT